MFTCFCTTLLILYLCVVLAFCTCPFGEHVYRPSLLCNPCLLTKIDNNNNYSRDSRRTNIYCNPFEQFISYPCYWYIQPFTSNSPAILPLANHNSWPMGVGSRQGLQTGADINASSDDATRGHWVEKSSLDLRGSTQATGQGGNRPFPKWRHLVKMVTAIWGTLIFSSIGSRFEMIILRLILSCGDQVWLVGY